MEGIDKYLPLGTIVFVKNDIVMRTIVGYLSKNENNEIKDYTTIPFPYGLMAPEIINYYNHEDIEQIIYMGYKNKDFEVFNEILKK